MAAFYEFDERREALLDVLDPALAAPVALRRKVDDVLGVDHHSGFEDEHPAGTHVPGLGGALICCEVLRKSLLELQRDALPHEPDAVHRIHERLDISLE